MIFSQAYAQSPLTVASHATILTGTYPQTHRASEFGVPLAPASPYLPDLLHANGYRTGAFVGSILLDPRNGPFQKYDRGFDFYDADFHDSQPADTRFPSVRRGGGDVVARAIQWLSARKQNPIFLWVHLHDPAAPDASPNAHYDHAVSATDAAVGKLLNFLRARSIYEDSVIVVAGAHGESLGAHGEDTHGMFLYDETIRVPLLLKLPKLLLAGKQVKNRVRLLDVAPTILEAVAIPVPSQMQGQSLLRISQSNAQADQLAYARSDLPVQGFQSAAIESLRAGKYLYIRAPRPELYDLFADPNATRNLAPTSKATLDTLAAQLQSLDDRLANSPGRDASGGLSSAEMQKLASLGYVGLQKSAAGVSAASQGIDPKDVVGTANKVLAALRDLDDGHSDKAIAGLRPVLAAQPNTYLAQYAMGMAFAQKQQYADAVGYLHKAIELQPDSAFAHYAMGLNLEKTGDFKTASVHLEIAAQRLPDLSALHVALAAAYDHLGRAQDAARERATAVKREAIKRD